MPKGLPKRSKQDNAIARAIKAAGGRRVVSQELGISYSGVRRWSDAGRWPRSEASGDTDYARQLARLQTEVPFEELNKLAFARTEKH